MAGTFTDSPSAAPAETATPERVPFTVEDTLTLHEQPEFKSLAPEEQQHVTDTAITDVHAAYQQEPGYDFNTFTQFADKIRQQTAPGVISKYGGGAVKGVYNMGKDLAAVPGAIVPGIAHPIETAKTAGSALLTNTVDWGRAGIDAASRVVSPAHRKAHQRADAIVDTIKKGKLPYHDPTELANWIRSTDDALSPVQQGQSGPAAARLNSITQPENVQLITQWLNTRNPETLKQLKHNLTMTKGERLVEARRLMAERSAGAAAFDAVYGKGAHQHLIAGADPVNTLMMFRAAQVAKGASTLGKVGRFAGEQTAWGVAGGLRANPNASAGELAEDSIKQLLMGSLIHAGSAAVRKMAGSMRPKSGSEAPETAPNPGASPQEPGSIAPKNGTIPEVTPNSASATRDTVPVVMSDVAEVGSTPTTGSPENPKVEIGKAESRNQISEFPISEFPNFPSQTIAHADTDARAVAAGFEIPARGTRWTVEGAAAEAAERMKDPTYAGRMVQFYMEQPDARIDPVNAVVLNEHLGRQAEAFDALRIRLKTLTPESPEHRAAAAELDKLETSYKDSLALATKAGSAWGSEGRARQIARSKQIFEHLPSVIYTLEAKRGKPLDATEKAQVAKEFDDAKAADEAAAKAQAAADANKSAENAPPIAALVQKTARSAKEKRQIVADTFARMLGKPVTGTSQGGKSQGVKSQGKPLPKTPRAPMPSEARSAAEKAQDDYQQQRAAAVKAAEAAERRTMAAEDDVQSRSRQAQVEHAAADMHTDDVIHPDDAQKAAETMAPEREQRARQAGEVAGHEFDAMHADHPGHPENVVTENARLGLKEDGTPIFMDATGLLTITKILHQTARDVHSLAAFTARALRQFGAWIKPHLQALWNAARRGLGHLQSYLKGLWERSEIGTAGPHSPGEIKAALASKRNGVTADQAAIHAAHHYAQEAKDNGKVTMAAWKTRMEENGQTPTPELFAAGKALYDAQMRAAGDMSPQDVMESYKGEQLESLHPLAAELAKAHVSADPTLTGTDPAHSTTLTQRVQADLASMGHALTESETGRAITGYGEQPTPTVSPVQKRLRELKAQILADEKILDAKEGKLPWIRKIISKLSDPVRRKLQTLRDEVRKIETEEVKAGRMKSAQARVVSALTNQIKDLEAQRAGSAAARKPNAPITDTPEMAALRAHRDALAAALAAQRDPTGDIGYNQRATAAARASAELYRRKLASGKFTTPLTPGHPLTAETLRARAEAATAKRAFDDAAEASGERAAARLERALAQMQARAMELQQEISTGVKPAGTPPKFIDKNSAAYRAKRAELARLQAILKDRRLLAARSAKEAADAMARGLDTRIAELERITAEARRQNRAAPNAEAELTRLNTQRAEIDAPALARFKALQDARAARYGQGEAEITSSGQVPVKKSPRQIKLDDEARAKEVAAVKSKKRLEHIIYEMELKAQPWYQKIMRWPARAKRGLVLLGAQIYLKLAIAGNVARPFMTFMEETLGRGFLKVLLPDVMRNAPGEGGSSGMTAFADYGRGWARGWKELGNVMFTGQTTNQMMYGAKGESMTRPQWEAYLTAHPHAAMKAPAWEAAFSMSEGNRIAHAGYESADTVPKAKLDDIRRAAALDADHHIYKNDNVLSQVYNRALSSMKSAGPAGQMISEALKFENIIVKIPTNLVGEAAKYLVGSLYAPIKLAMTKAKQSGKLTPEQYDSIARTFKKGMTFATLVAIAYLVPGAIRMGGQYVPGEKRKHDDLHPGDVEIFGHKLPHIATHAGVFTAAQAIATGLRDAEKSGSITHATIQTIMGTAAEVPMVRGTGEFFSNIGTGKEKEQARSRALKGIIPAPLRLAAEHQDYHGPHSFLYRLTIDSDHENVTNRGSTFSSGIPSWVPLLPNRQQLPVKRH